MAPEGLHDANFRLGIHKCWASHTINLVAWSSWHPWFVHCRSDWYAYRHEFARRHCRKKKNT